MHKLLTALGMVLFFGCRAFDPALLNPTQEAIPVQLPSLVLQVQPLHLDSQLVGNDVKTLFAREVCEVMAGHSGPPQGFAVLTTRRLRYSEGRFFSYASGLTLGSGTLLGLPWAWYRCTVDVQLDIRSLNRELVGTYYAQGQAQSVGSLYSRTNYKQPERVLYLQCVRAGLEQIVSQLPAEMPHLQAALRN